jgi:hypothetical protein
LLRISGLWGGGAGASGKRSAATQLPPRLRSVYLARIGAALRGRDSVGDGELSRLAHAIARELSAPREQLGLEKREELVPGFDAVP